MTLPLGNRMDYTGNGAVDTYSYTFKILDEDDLTVAVRDPDTGVETILTKTTHYTVTGVGSAGGGSVALVNGSFDWLDSGGDLDTGWILTILRELPLLQETDLSTQSSFLPETIEDQMDRSIMIAQQQQDALDRSIRLPVTVDPDTFDPEVPASVVGEAGAILKVNSTGDGWTIGTADLPNATVTPYMETLLDDANAAAARTTLGLDGASGVVATGDIAALAVTAAKLAADAVTTAKILDANVTTAKINDAAVTADKLATGAVTPTKAAAYGIQAVVSTGAGHGSTNTKIRRIETAVVSAGGSDITVTHSATGGTSLTINTAGLYTVNYTDTISSATIGLSLNSNQLTTNIQSITAAHILEYIDALVDTKGSVTVTRWFAANDVIRPHTDGAPASTASAVRLSITRIL